MKPKPQLRDSFELFQAHFDQMLDPGHELIQLARKIDWAHLDAAGSDLRKLLGLIGRSAGRFVLALREPPWQTALASAGWGRTGTGDRQCHWLCYLVAA